MASDEDYMSFLDKANQDASGGGKASTQSGGQNQKFKTTDSGAEVPKEIQEVTKDAFYVSDADEPFVGVSLKYDGSDSMPDEGMRPCPTLSYPILPLPYHCHTRGHADSHGV
jgi:hypothetical protein